MDVCIFLVWASKRRHRGSTEPAEKEEQFALAEICMWRAVTFFMTTWRTMQNIMFSIVLFIRIKFGGMDAKQCPSLSK